MDVAFHARLTFAYLVFCLLDSRKSPSQRQAKTNDDDLDDAKWHLNQVNSRPLHESATNVKFPIF